MRLCKLPTGGAFGNRLVMDMACPIAAILSAKTGQAVKIVNTRQEEFETSKTRYRYLIDMKTGVKKDGRIHARAARVIADNGAYNDKAPATLSFSGSMFCLIYDVEHLQYDGYAVYTNRQYGTGFRGFGNPQVTFAPRASGGPHRPAPRHGPVGVPSEERESARQDPGRRRQPEGHGHDGMPGIGRPPPSGGRKNVRLMSSASRENPGGGMRHRHDGPYRGREPVLRVQRGLLRGEGVRRRAGDAGDPSLRRGPGRTNHRGADLRGGTRRHPG